MIKENIVDIKGQSLYDGDYFLFNYTFYKVIDLPPQGAINDNAMILDVKTNICHSVKVEHMRGCEKLTDDDPKLTYNLVKAHA